MGLNSLRWAAHRARFDDVRIQGTLHQPVNLAFFPLDAVSFLVEYRNELIADYLALGLGVGYSLELSEKSLSRVYRDHMQAKPLAQVLLNFLELVLAQHAVVDKHGGEAGISLFIAQRAIHQGCSDRGVHSPREGRDRTPVADSLAHAGNGFFNKTLGGPVRLGSADLEGEIAQDVRAQRGVVHFRMKLHRPHLSLGILDGCHRAGRFRG